MRHSLNRLGIAACLTSFCIGCGSDNAAPTGSEIDATPLPSRYELSDAVAVPEGIAFDPVDRAFYVSGVDSGRITRVDRDGSESVFRAPDGDRTIGLKVDAENRRLWACAGEEVLLLDLATGSEIRQFDLSQFDRTASCNDLALDSRGRAYITDPRLAQIYLAEPDGSLVIFAADPLLDAALVGANGVVITPGDEYMLVAVFVGRRLVRVDLQNPSEVVEIDLGGDDLEPPDGLELLDGKLYSVSDKTVQRVVFDSENYASGVVSTIQTESGLSTATRAEGRLYAVRSGITTFVTGGDPGPFAILEVDLDGFE